MLRNVLRYFGLLLLSGPLTASMILQYSVTGMNEDSVEFSNGSSFEIQSAYLPTFSNWENGDQVRLFNDDKPFPPIIIRFRDGFPYLVPPFVLTNMTQSTEVVGWLNVPANPSSLKITAIDTEAGQVTLSDATMWQVAAEYLERLLIWAVNDTVMIGTNEGLYACSFDAILFNTDKQSYTCAEEQ